MIIDLSYGPEEEVEDLIKVEEFDMEEIEAFDLTDEALAASAREINNGFFAQQLQYANSKQSVGVIVGYSSWYDFQEKEEVESLRAQHNRFNPRLSDEIEVSE